MKSSVGPCQGYGWDTWESSLPDNSSGVTQVQGQAKESNFWSSKKENNVFACEAFKKGPKAYSEGKGDGISG